MLKLVEEEKFPLALLISLIGRNAGNDGPATF
jgi:hypothetical protein